MSASSECRSSSERAVVQTDLRAMLSWGFPVVTLGAITHDQSRGRIHNQASQIHEGGPATWSTPAHSTDPRSGSTAALRTVANLFRHYAEHKVTFCCCTCGYTVER